MDTKRRLIETARDLIWKSSYGAVSVDDICAAAGARKGSFYHFFPSKVSLAIAAMEDTVAQSRPRMDEIFSPASDPVSRFARFADYVVETQVDAARRYGRVCGCPCASLGCEMAGQEEAIRRAFEAASRFQERYFENALRDMAGEGLLPEGADVRDRARQVSAYVVGQLTLARIGNDVESLNRDFRNGLLAMLGVTASRIEKACI